MSATTPQTGRLFACKTSLYRRFPVILSLILLCLPTAAILAQALPDSIAESNSNINPTRRELRGRMLDMDKHAPLPYTDIYILHKNKGVISNENGYFALDITGLVPDDTVCFQYIGYHTRKIPLDQADTTSVIFMKEEIINLSQVLVFGNPPDPAWIVRQVLQHKDSNYRKTTAVEQTFIRERNIFDFDEMNLIYKKSDIPGIDKDLLKTMEEKIPKHTTSFTDFLGNLYFTENIDDSVRLKINPVRLVELREKEMDDLQQYDTLFDNIFTETGDNEYWKIRSGIFGQKLDDVDADTVIQTDTVMRKDTVDEYKRNVADYARQILSMRRYSTLESKDKWEFLHHPGRYDFSLAGGTTVNGDDAYIIDFTPKSSGTYTGRLFISTTTYALIRADYEYAPGKIGLDIHLLGIGYTEIHFSGSIYFEKQDDHYVLKYFSNRATIRFSVNRSMVVVKKKKQRLFDKVVNEFKANLEISGTSENSIEYLALDDRKLSEKEYADFQPPEEMEIIFVDQFDDKLWDGYSIIEPTERMKEYRKGSK